MNAIKRLRNAKHLSQSELAKIVNVGQNTISNWETGRTDPDYESLSILSNYFAVPIDYLLGTGVFNNWDMIINNKDNVCYALRQKIPMDFSMGNDESYLVAQLERWMVYDFDEIATARWFSFAVKSVIFDEDEIFINFTPEFEAIIKNFISQMDRHSKHPKITTAKEAAESFLKRIGVKVPVLGDVAAGIPIEAIQDIVDYEEIDAALASTGDFFGLRIKGASMEPRMREGDVVIVRKQDDADTGDTVVVLVNGDSATVKKLKKGPDGITLVPTNPSYDPMFYSKAEVASLPVRIIGRVVELRAKY